MKTKMGRYLSPCPMEDPNCHIPNETPKKVLEKIEKRIGLNTYNSVEEMFESLGISQC